MIAARKPNRPAQPRRSNRETVQWVPVTEASFARAVLAAEIAEVDLAVWLDEAIKLHLAKARVELQDRLYREACERASVRMEGEPTRREFDRQYREDLTRRPGQPAMQRRGPASVSSPAPHS